VGEKKGKKQGGKEAEKAEERWTGFSIQLISARRGEAGGGGKNKVGGPVGTKFWCSRREKNKGRGEKGETIGTGSVNLDGERLIIKCKKGGVAPTKTSMKPGGKKKKPVRRFSEHIQTKG